MRVYESGSRVIGLGAIFALAGFAYAVSTSATQSGSAAISPRAVGTNILLNFTTPNLMSGGVVVNASEYDLGDACFGSLITRFITAEGGIRPYRFTSTGNLSLLNVIANTGSSLTLGISGVLAGSTPGSVAPNSRTFAIPPANLGTPGFRFQVTVADANGVASATQSGFFNLALYDCSKVFFRFANDTLPRARLDAAYFANVTVLGGHAPVTFSSIGVTNKDTGTVVKLSDLGLFLGPDGSIYGRPLTTGTFLIGVRAVDGSGVVARNRRNPNALDQVFTLVIGDNLVTFSDTMTQSCTVMGDMARPGNDSLTLSGLINALGQDQFSLVNSEFSFQLGGINLSGRLDQHGRLVQRNPDRSVFSIIVNARNGTISINALRGSLLTKAFDLTNVKNGDTVRMPLQIVVGDAVKSAEVLNFAVSLKKTRYKFNFNQGRAGYSASGGFQIVSVQGRDDIATNGQLGDSWRVGFVALPRLGVTNPAFLPEGLTNITAVNIRIGTNFSQSFSGIGVIGAGPAIRFRGGPVDGVQSFSLNTTTSKGLLVTRTLGSNITGIPTVANSLRFTNIFFPLGLDITRLPNLQPFVGEYARRIFGGGTRYTDQPPRRQSPSQ